MKLRSGAVSMAPALSVLLEAERWIYPEFMH